MKNKQPNSVYAEEAVIGSIILESTSERCQNALRFLTADMFYSRIRQIIFEVLVFLNTNQKPIDLITLENELTTRGMIANVGGIAYLAELCKVPVMVNVGAYVDSIKNKYLERVAMNTLAQCAEELTDKNGLSTEEKLDRVQKTFSSFDDICKQNSHGGLVDLHSISEKWLDEVEDRYTNASSARGMTIGICAFDEILAPKGLVKGSLLVIGARPKMGKAQTLSSKILLNNGGWTTFKNVKVGDRLASIDGEKSIVTGVFPRGIKDIYEVKFSDGRIVECADDHLWEVHCSKFSDKKRIVDTVKLFDLLSKVRYQSRISVPSISGEFGIDTNLGINGWLLGVLIGDGCLRNRITFSTNEDYILERVKKSISNELSIKNLGKYDYSISDLKNKKNEIRESMENLGIFNLKSQDKFIPERIYSSTKKQRIDVLTGILETDGWVEKFGSISFSSSSERLVDGVQKLVWSLGGVARKTLKENVSYLKNGVRVKCLNAHILHIRLPDEVIQSIKSPRLQKNINPIDKRKTPSPIITSVKFKGYEEGVCISVSHNSHLYATDNYIMTHNTSMLVKMALNCAMNEKKPAIIFSLEMPADQLFERMITQVSGVSSDIFYDAAKNESQFNIALNSVGEIIRNGNIFIDDTPAISLNHIISECRRIKREKGQLGMIFVDYLTLMKPEKAERNDLAYGAITKGLKALAKELSCVVVLITQLNRNLENRAGDKRPYPSDSRDTGQIEQDCDYWFGLYRDRVYNEQADPHLTEIILRLNRHGKIGTAYVDMKYGQIFEIDQSKAQLSLQKATTENKMKKRNKYSTALDESW